MKLNLLSLGCAKNLVDSEGMLNRLSDAGWILTDEPAEADIIVVNTCGFIETAINESIDAILELAAFREHGNCKRLIVAGCLPQRFGADIARALPEVDIFLGTGAFDQIVQAAEGEIETRNLKPDAPLCVLPDPNASEFARSYKTGLNWEFGSHAAYIKVAEGCSRHCTYCIIPKLRGKQRSRTPDDILAQAWDMIESGVRELILIAQDTTGYGSDLQDMPGLGGLLERISDLSPDIWIRFLYGHPESIDRAVIRIAAERPNICSYFDIPIQHASTRILKKMGRHYSRGDLYRLFDKIRSADPEASLRTTMITGFPGESDEDFELMLKFAEDIRFDHLGVFTYSDAEDIPSHRLPGHVPKKTATDRCDRLMSRQSGISLKNNEKYMGKTLRAIVDEKLEANLFAGRTMFQSPEVDGLTYIHADNLDIGSFVRVKITDVLEYDLVGETV